MDVSRVVGTSSRVAVPGLISVVGLLVLGVRVRLVVRWLVLIVVVCLVVVVVCLVLWCLCLLCPVRVCRLSVLP